MLVALPAAIAFGVIIFAPLGRDYVVLGAVAGILGTTAVGLVAPAFGGTKRLITAPSAPAAAVLSAFTLQSMHEGVRPETILLMMALVALFCGGLQILFGIVGLGRLIKYMPYPVVSGYLSGVGLIIILSQVPKFLGAPSDAHFWHAVTSPSLWRWQAIAVGAVTMLVMVFAPKVTKVVPAAIAALLFGVATYFVAGYFDHSLLDVTQSRFIIGPLTVSKSAMVEAIVGRWRAAGTMDLSRLSLLLMPALTLAVLLSIDTLKTCVVLDALTRSRHDSNRELIGQGLGNLASAMVGGVPGSGTMGATLVNMSSGARTRVSGIFEGAFALAALLLLGNLIAWVPIAALAGILIVVGVRMFDRQSLHLLKSKTTILDFFVIVAVIAVAETVSLIAASAVGIGLAAMLFIREQIGGAVVRRKLLGNQIFSKQVRLPQETAILESRGDRTVIFELQGSLFFGTADQLYSAVEPELKQRQYIILDMRRVQSVDVTAAHVMERLQDMCAEQERFLIFSHLPSTVPTGQDMMGYFDQVGLVRPEHHAQTFDHLHAALEWVEDRILAEERLEHALEQPLGLREIELFRGRKEETLAALEACMEERIFHAGEAIFHRGDDGDEMFLIRRGAVRILMPLEGRSPHHLATFSRGDFFGEMTFLDGRPRSADAVAHTTVETYVLSRKRFDELTETHKKTAIQLLEAIARELAIRLRHTDNELLALQDA